MNDTPEGIYFAQLKYAREQCRIWAHLGLAERYQQIDAHLESEFGYVMPSVIGDALFTEGWQ